MSCLLCTNAVAMHFDRMFAHVKYVHGHTKLQYSAGQDCFGKIPNYGKSQIMACHQCIVKHLKDSWEA